MLFYFFPLFSSGIFLTHDGENHLARIASYSSAIMDGHFPVRWAGNLNYSYGSAVFIFFYPLPYMMAFIFHLIGFSIVGSFKIILFLSFAGGAVAYYFFAKQFVRRDVALVSSVLYMIAPYHILNMYVRGDIGELLAYVFIPLIWYSIESFRKKSDVLTLVLGSFFYALLILSHNGVSLLFTPIVLLYILLFVPTLKKKALVSVIIPLGLALSSFFWIPAILESKYTNAKIFVGDFFRSNFFSSPIDFIHSPWGFGANINTPEGLAPQIGLFYFIALSISVIILIRLKMKIKESIFWVAIFLIGFFLALPISRFLWENIQVLKLFQFPWRLIILSTFSALVLITFGLDRIRNGKWLYLILLVSVLSTIPFIRTREYTYYDDAFYYSFPGTTYFHGEATSIWSAGDAFERPGKSIEIIEGIGSINSEQRKSTKHHIHVRAETEMNIVDNTYYFPGWKVFVDGIETGIQFQDPGNRGLITFRVPRGEHEILVVFEETKVRIFSIMLSLSALGGIFFLVYSRKLFNKIIT